MNGKHVGNAYPNEDDDQAKGNSLQGSNRDAQRVREAQSRLGWGLGPSGAGVWALWPVAGERWRVNTLTAYQNSYQL